MLWGCQASFSLFSSPVEKRGQLFSFSVIIPLKSTFVLRWFPICSNVFYFLLYYKSLTKDAHTFSLPEMFTYFLCAAADTFCCQTATECTGRGCLGFYFWYPLCFVYLQSISGATCPFNQMKRCFIKKREKKS